MLSGKKTYIVALGIVCSAVGAYLTGDATLGESLLMVMNGLGLAGLRHGIKKAEV